MIDESFWSDLERRLLLLPNASSMKIQGATDEEISSVEQYAGLVMPKTYREFMHRMGRCAGKLFQGSDYSVLERHRIRFRVYAERLLLKSKSSFVLPQDVFIFLMHQGYQFLYFPLEQGDDPPVFLVTEREPHPQQISPHLSSYIDKYVTDLEQLIKQHPEFFGENAGSTGSDNAG